MRLLPNKYYIIKHFLQERKMVDCAYKKQFVANRNQQIQYYNWWQQDAYSHWLGDFIEKRGLLNGTRKTIALCSVFDDERILDKLDTDVRIFFSGENLHNVRHSQYADYRLSGKCPFDLGIGFDYFEAENYLRFPLWMMYMFAPNATEDDICRRCEQLRYPPIGDKNKFCSLVARADWNGVRGNIADEVAFIDEVNFPSSFRHNDDSLQNDFGNDKVAYLKQFKYNICPENTNAYGYVTEKVFESIAAGCIPIYWGSFGNPEPDILNIESILFWNKDVDNSGVIETIRQGFFSSNIYMDFATQPRLKDNAESIIIQRFNMLESKLRQLIS